MTGSDSYQAAADLLREWVLRRLDQPQRAWLDAQIDSLARFQPIVDQALTALAPKVKTLEEQKRDLAAAFVAEATDRARAVVPEWDNPVLVRLLVPLRPLVPVDHPGQKVFDIYGYLEGTVRSEIAAVSTVEEVGKIDPTAETPFSSKAGWPK